MTGLHHVGFTVSDLTRSVEFYRSLLQREPLARRVYREPYIAEIVGYRDVELDAAFFELPGSSVILELLEYRRPPAGRVDMETYNIGNAHLCLLVEDLGTEFDRLIKTGIRFRSDKPVDIVAGVNRGGRAVYLRDPDDITIEIIEKPRSGAALPANAG